MVLRSVVLRSVVLRSVVTAVRFDTKATPARVVNNEKVTNRAAVVTLKMFMELEYQYR